MHLFMKKSIFIIVLAVVFSMIMSASVYAYTGKTNYPNVNFRAEATTDSESMGKLPEGTEVEVVSYEDDWYKVKYDGKTGYIYSQYLEADSSAKSEENTEETNTEEKKEESVEEKKEENKEETKSEEGVEIQLYVLPLLNSTKLDVLTSKSGIEVLSEAGKWSYVKTEKGNGWVITSKIKDQEKNTIPDTKVNEIDPNDTENVTVPDGEGKDSEEAKNETSEAKAEEYNGAYPVTMYVNVKAVNIRADASIDADRIETAELNTSYNVTGKYGDWYEVEVNGKKGFISSQFLSTKKSE